MKTTNKNDLLEQIEELQELINEKLVDKDNFELDASEYEENYCDMLDECYPEVFNILPSRILLECDPIAYSCGLNDYVDSLEVENDENYQELEEEIEELESQVYDLEEEIENL
ncbi:MAG: hypothetical protein GY739_12205 [Mesoflavibacter sp.]|nr:hypothetical protein [Mesoflavibacter sp.]